MWLPLQLKINIEKRIIGKKFKNQRERVTKNTSVNTSYNDSSALESCYSVLESLSVQNLNQSMRIFEYFITYSHAQ